MRTIVTGLIGQYAFGGVTWDYIQYALGFRKLGHDVWYLEDTGAWAYDPVKMEPSADCSHNTAYLARVMEEFGMGDRWLYRNGADGSWHGAVRDAADAARVLASADVLANVSGACWLGEETAAIPVKLFLDGDPMFTHIGLAADPESEYAKRVRAHERHFSFGLNIGAADCVVPVAGIDWRPTVQPVALEYWSGDAVAGGHVAEGAWTTVMNWASYAPKEFEGRKYGQKDIEFEKFVDLPSLTRERFVLAMGQGVGQKRPTEMLESKGWTIIEPDRHLPNFTTYREFLAASKGEWSIAKNGYVQSRSGWFSCRSACYLAAGKPVVVQDTGWSGHLPAGDGVVAFSTLEEAAAGVERVAGDYAAHSRAARVFAERHFEAGKVCAELVA